MCGNHGMHFVSHDVMTPICLATVQLQFVMQASQCRLHFRQTQHTDCMHVEERSLSVCSSTCVGVCVCAWADIPADVGGHFVPFINLRPHLKHAFYILNLFPPRRRLGLLDIKQCQDPCCYGGAPCSWLAGFIS